VRDSAFAADSRFVKKGFMAKAGQIEPLVFAGEVIGEIKLLTVIANEGYAQAVFDFDLHDDASFDWRNKKRHEYAYVEDKTCRCRCTK